MNQRIRELVEQAGGNPNYKAFGGHFLPPPPDYIDPATVDLAKFAELIVRECADTAENCFVYWPMDGSLQRKGCANAIKKHFGVEE